MQPLSFTVNLDSVSTHAASNLLQSKKVCINLIRRNSIYFSANLLEIGPTCPGSLYGRMLCFVWNLIYFILKLYAHLHKYMLSVMLFSFDKLFVMPLVYGDKMSFMSLCGLIKQP